MHKKLFIEYDKYTKPDGVIVTKYKPNYDIIDEIKIKTIDIKTGAVEYKKILEFSKHENIRMYKLTIYCNKHWDDVADILWVSEDHSLIVYDMNNDRFIKETPLNIVNNFDYYLVIEVESELFNKIDKNALEFVSKYDNLAFIPKCLFDIQFDKNRTVGYDFTVEDNYTFITSSGLFVQDSMAIHAVHSNESQSDLNKMLEINNAISQGSLKYGSVSQHIAYAFYKITYDNPNPKFVRLSLNSYPLYDDVKIKDIKLGKYIELNDLLEKYEYNTTLFVENLRQYTTVGRLLVTLLFDLNKLISEPVNGDKLNALITNVIHQYHINKKYTYDDIVDLLNTINYIGSKYGNDMTIKLSDFVVDDEFEKEVSKKMYEIKKMLKDNAGNNVVVAKTSKTINALTKKLKDELSDGIKNIIDSKAKGNLKQMAQIFIAKGFLFDVTGKMIKTPILNPLYRGLTEEDFIVMSAAARKGSADRSIHTADSGYMTRKLVYALNTVVVDELVDFCKTNRYFKIHINKSNYTRFLYRYINDNGRRVLLTPNNIKHYIGKIVNLYSPILCKLDNDRICKTCLGKYYDFFNSKYFGIMAAQAMGERTTQLIMQTFHVGSAISLDNVNFPLDLIYEENNVFHAKQSFTINVESNIDIDDEHKLLSTITGTVVLDNNKEYQFQLSPPLNVYFVIDDSGTYNIEKGDKLFSLIVGKSDLSNKLQFLSSLIEKRRPIKSAKDILLYYKDLDSIFGEYNIMSIWYEILISKQLIDLDTNKPLRNIEGKLNDILKNNNIVIESILNIPYHRPLSGIAFENVGKALQHLTDMLYDNNGLITIDDLSIMEKILLQNI